MATKFEKNVFGIFRFSLVAISSKMQMHEDPFFFEPSILNIRTKYDITVEQLKLVIACMIWVSKSYIRVCSVPIKAAPLVLQ